MEYQSILKRIEDEKREESLSAKLYRYSGLMQAIEFFSQKLNFEQIIDASFDFVNELLVLERSAIFVLQGNNYVLKKLKGYGSVPTLIKSDGKLQELAVLHGTLLSQEEQLLRFFDSEILKSLDVTAAIPLMIENSLFGFIFMSHKTMGASSDDDYIISESLMRLFNNALENYKRYEELQNANKELDEKVFNLFAINQSSKALLSELSLDVLYNLSVDVFSELTQSSITSFVLYDEKSEQYTLKAFKDIFYKVSNVHIHLSANKLARIDPNRIIIDVSNELDVLYFNTVFKDGLQQLDDLKPMYIILLLKNSRVHGFVTLGQPVTGINYKKSIFELIESLASATFIALSNAQLFKQVNEQRKIIQSKLDKLVSLNNLMKNINSSSNIETLLDLTLKTLNVSFDVEKALIATYNKENETFEIADTLNIETENKAIEPNDNWAKVFEGDAVYEAKEDGILKYISKTLLHDIGSNPGILIVPICIDRLEIEMLGVIIIFKYGKAAISDEESRLIMETISGHIAPVLSNLHTIEEQSRFLLPNYIEIFKRDLKTDISEALDFTLDLRVIQVMDNRSFVFKSNNIIEELQKNFPKVYPFSYNNIFIITNEIDENVQERIARLTGIIDIVVKVYTMGKEFGNYQEFFKLF